MLSAANLKRHNNLNKHENIYRLFVIKNTVDAAIENGCDNTNDFAKYFEQQIDAF